MSPRRLKVASVIKRVVGRQLQQLLPGVYCSLTEVKVSPDLKTATVWVSSLKGPSGPKLIEHLEAHKLLFQRALAAQLQAKFTPKLDFRYDRGVTHAAAVDKILKNLK